MEFQEVLEYLSELQPYTDEQILGKEDFTVMRALLKALGNPENDLKFIHIAGTNGKGSTASILENILLTAGVNVASYKAPGFDRYNRVIKVNGEEITDEELVALVSKVKEAADSLNLDRSLALNELMFAVSLLFYVEKEAELVIVKVVMGGMHDITNVIPAPLFTLFTPIGLDHVEILGGKIDVIAQEKSGIIKSGTTVISAVQPPEAEVILRLKCMEENVPYFTAPDGFYKGFDMESMTQRFKVINTEASRIPKEYEKIKALSEEAGSKVFETKMLGLCQLSNAALALGISALLIKFGFDISMDDMEKGVRDIVWPGSFEIVSEKPYVIVDAAHNVASVQSLMETLERYFPGKKFHFVIDTPILNNSIGMVMALRGKAYDVRLVGELNSEETVDKISKLFETTDVNIMLFDELDKAIEDATSKAKEDEIIVSFGSLQQALFVKELKG